MKDARTLLREAGLVAKKSFGQNFLVAEGIARKIAEACVPDAELGRARVVEIGAGLGALTRLLAERAREVIAIERDRDLVPVLTRLLEGIARARVVEADAKRADLGALLGPASPDVPRVLCGNLPYQITGPLLERATELSRGLERAVFMVQREVADRLLAPPSTKEYGALTVFVRAAFDVHRVAQVTPGAFHPRPDVSSTVVRMTPLLPARAEETPLFRRLVRSAFQARRKTLRNAWSGVARAPEELARAARVSDVSLDARGETLDPEAFGRMARALEGD